MAGSDRLPILLLYLINHQYGCMGHQVARKGLQDRIVAWSSINEMLEDLQQFDTNKYAQIWYAKDGSGNGFSMKSKRWALLAKMHGTIRRLSGRPATGCTIE